MHIHPLTVTVSAPRDTVFNFLADIENLPKWAGAWCERLALQRGRWWALTSEGEQVMDMETSAGTGVIVWQESITSESSEFNVQLATEGAAPNNIAQALAKISRLNVY